MIRYDYILKKGDVCDQHTGKEMKNKVLAAVLCVAMTASIFAGCGAKTEEAPAETQEETTEVDEEEEETEEVAEEGEVNSGTFTTVIDMSSYETGSVVRLWLPCPQTDEYQTIENENVELDTAHAISETTTDEHGNKILYVEWDKEATERTLTYTFDATRKEILCPELAENSDTPDEAYAEYLEPTSTLPVDGEVKALADQIVDGKDTNVKKVRAIYDWVIANMVRDDEVVGCGLGNVPELLTTLKGKCTDINSVFVALCRAAGIPAREYFGIRMSTDPEADMTSGQHCWAEFYLEGTGWVAADPADVLKAILKNEWTKDSAEAKEKQEYFWGNSDALRISLSTGRDLILEPAQDGAPLNNFGYPYAEVDGKSINCYAPEDFDYSISFKNAN